MRYFTTLLLLLICSGCATTDNGQPAAKTEPATVSGPQFQPSDFLVTQNAGIATYGFTEADPVKVGGPENGPGRERRFLNQLAGPKGETITFTRIGSCCPFSTPSGFMGTGMLDKYQIYVAGDPAPKILFLNMYDYEQPLVPNGFTAKKG